MAPGAARRTVISVDAMGGDTARRRSSPASRVPRATIPASDFILHGPEAELARLVRSAAVWREVVTVRNADGVVTMDDKPSHAMRHGKGTSMWSALEAVEAREAEVCVSCGNTGALMAMSMLRLRKLPGVHRPAIACLWPSRNPPAST